MSKNLARLSICGEYWCNTSKKIFIYHIKSCCEHWTIWLIEPNFWCYGIRETKRWSWAVKSVIDSNLHLIYLRFLHFRFFWFYLRFLDFKEKFVDFVLRLIYYLLFIFFLSFLILLKLGIGHFLKKIVFGLLLLIKERKHIYLVVYFIVIAG